MKKLLQITGLLLGMLLGVLGWLFLKQSKLQEEIQKPVAAARTEPKHANPLDTDRPTGAPEANVAEVMALKNDLKLTPAQETVLRDDPDAAHRLAMFAQARGQENSRRFDCYGKVVDQYGQPIPGVLVRGSILQVVSPISSANKEVRTETDAMGRFQFVGLHGADFGMLLQKSGYESDGRSDWSAAKRADPGDPVVFVMWKLQGPEPLLHNQLTGRLPYDDHTGSFAAFFGIGTGQRSSVGDMRVTVTQNPLVVRRGVDRFDWSVTIDLPEGGVVKAGDQYKNLAPPESYKTSWKFAQSKESPDWNPRLMTSLYVKTAKGQYGRINIDVTAGSNRQDSGLGIGISLEFWLNPSGSRNLEYDPAKAIKPTL